MSRSVLLLASEPAGGTDDEALAVTARGLGGDVELVRTSTRGDLQRALDGRDGRRTVVAGGDGSLHAVVAALFHRGELPDADLALVPLGTGNDFAHTAGIPLDPAAAAAVAVSGVRRRLDLVVDDRGEVVVNVVHAGVGADAAERAAAMKPALGAAAYPVGAIIAGATTDGWSVAVEADGAVVHEHGPVLMVAVCNGRTVGGGTQLCPPADPADGVLDLLVVTAVSPLARVAFGADLRRGVHLERDDVVHVRARTVTVHGGAVGYNADGEIGRPVAARSFALLPSAWSLITPATWPAPGAPPATI